MADRYWVGGTAAWDATAGSKWATSSGGAGGATVPTSADNVFFTAASGSGVCTLQTAAGNCANIDFTGYTGTFTMNQSLNVYGSFKMVPGTTWNFAGNGITFAATTTNGGVGHSIDWGGKSVGGGATFNGVGGKWVLASALSIGTFATTNGTLDTANYNISCTGWSTATGTITLTLGSSAITVAGSGNAISWNTLTTMNFTAKIGRAHV